MTKAQKETIERLRKDILEHDGLGKEYMDDYEYKDFKVTEMPNIGIVFLATVVGSKTDEGTMAAVLCRRRRNIKIGPRGGVTSIIPGHRASGYRNVLIWGYEY